MRNSHIGIKQSEETKRKRALAMTGKSWKVSEIGRKNMSESQIKYWQKKKAS